MSTVCSFGYETWGPMNSQDVTSCVFNHVTMEGRNLWTIPKIRSAWRSWTAALICCWNQRAPQAGTDGSSGAHTGPLLVRAQCRNPYDPTQPLGPQGLGKSPNTETAHIVPSCHLGQFLRPGAWMETHITWLEGIHAIYALDPSWV